MSIGSEDDGFSSSPHVEDVMDNLSDDDFINVGALDDFAEGENS
jgi:hypothetical protein